MRIATKLLGLSAAIAIGATSLTGCSLFAEKSIDECIVLETNPAAHFAGIALPVSTYNNFRDESAEDPLVEAYDDMIVVRTSINIQHGAVFSLIKYLEPTCMDQLKNSGFITDDYDVIHVSPGDWDRK